MTCNCGKTHKPQSLTSKVPTAFIVAWFTGAVLVLTIGAMIIAGIVKYISS